MQLKLTLALTVFFFHGKIKHTKKLVRFMMVRNTRYLSSNLSNTMDFIFHLFYFKTQLEHLHLYNQFQNPATHTCVLDLCHNRLRNDFAFISGYIENTCYVASSNVKFSMHCREKVCALWLLVWWQKFNFKNRFAPWIRYRKTLFKFRRNFKSVFNRM